MRNVPHLNFTVQFNIGPDCVGFSGSGAGQRIGLEFLIQLFHIVGELSVVQWRDLRHIRLNNALGINGFKDIPCVFYIK